MKKKVINVKLNLKKELIAKLSNNQIHKILGGDDPETEHSRIACPVTLNHC